ncbi:MAG: hypothetical protein C7N36_04395 [Bacteroidetes bacterium]|nr:MAG: hypothetical protein C7N36_04395 [Bacteroidota bacterium]
MLSSFCDVQAPTVLGLGQLTDRTSPAATVKVDVQNLVIQSSVAVRVKDKFTAPPQTKAGRAGMDPIFELG